MRIPSNLASDVIATMSEHLVGVGSIRKCLILNLPDDQNLSSPHPRKYQGNKY